MLGNVSLHAQQPKYLAVCSEHLNVVAAALAAFKVRKQTQRPVKGTSDADGWDSSSCDGTDATGAAQPCRSTRGLSNMPSPMRDSYHDPVTRFRERSAGHMRVPANPNELNRADPYWMDTVPGGRMSDLPEVCIAVYTCASTSRISVTLHVVE